MAGVFLSFSGRSVKDDMRLLGGYLHSFMEGEAMVDEIEEQEFEQFYGNNIGLPGLIT